MYMNLGQDNGDGTQQTSTPEEEKAFLPMSARLGFLGGVGGIVVTVAAILWWQSRRRN